jgi:hypothetical protein
MPLSVEVPGRFNRFLRSKFFISSCGRGVVLETDCHARSDSIIVAKTPGDPTGA